MTHQPYRIAGTVAATAMAAGVLGLIYGWGNAPFVSAMFILFSSAALGGVFGRIADERN